MRHSFAKHETISAFFQAGYHIIYDQMIPNLILCDLVIIGGYIDHFVFTR